MRKIIAVIIVVMILAAVSPAAMAAGGGSGSVSLDFSKPDTGITDPNILKEIETPYPPSLNLLFFFLGAAAVIIIATIIAKKMIKKYRSKHRDIYGRW